ncbi:MAG: hypothetical protein J6X62_05250 [Bacteroidales bacterium]|nr:hypothetical protein [Bacteroidales bacterium]
MKRIALILLVATLVPVVSLKAQFRQDKPNTQFMMKLEAGAMPYVSNTGVEGEYGYYVNDRQMVGSFFLAMGRNIQHDFFVGMGVGYGYFTAPAATAKGLHSGCAYIDMDYRPFQTKYAPLVSAKIGADYMMGGAYGNTLTPYLEACAGINIYTKFRFVNHERDTYTSWYFQAGVTHTQHTFFIPARIGLRF